MFYLALVLHIFGVQIKTSYEASYSKISGDQLFYLMSRGFNEEEAMGLIVNGLEPKALVFF